ncbi:unnamed protein product [Discula destructiva]
MLIKDPRRLRLTFILGAAAGFLFLCLRLASTTASETFLGLNLSWPGPLFFFFSSSSSSSSPSSSSSSSHTSTTDGSVIRLPESGNEFIGLFGEITGFAPPITTRPGGGHPLHTELQSISTSDRKYFHIHVGREPAINPNIIPHPHREDTWIVVAQRRVEDENAAEDLAAAATTTLARPAVELVCNAQFVFEMLACVDDDDGLELGDSHPLPIAPTTTADPASCKDKLNFLSLNVGPHDARVFYGPRSPFVVYGSNSQFTCFGQWIQDLRGLVPDFWGSNTSGDEMGSSTQQMSYDDGGIGGGGIGGGGIGGEFTAQNGTEMQRPPPYAMVEKNWFLFWASGGEAFVHFDIAPRRSFAKLYPDGSVGPDLALASAELDDKCLGRYLPRVPDLTVFESVHQATNSLAVTLCRRADPECKPNKDNTFVFIIFQHKTFFEFHAAYHPYVMLFRQRAPFEVWAVSKRPIWISGRNLLPSGDTEMFYITSMSWRARGQTYHGYVDDVLFLAFGIEDRETAGIDVLAGDLLANLGLC